MSKETISPAPWHDNGNEIVDGNGKVIGGAFSNEDGALMAAAPDLLVALQKVMAHNVPFSGNPTHAEQVEFWEYEKIEGRGDADDMLAALAAIAKATGAA